MSVFNNLLLNLLIVSTMVSMCKSLEYTGQKITVIIINDLETQYNMAAHCKSADDDLGEHVLVYGANFEFHFKRNFAGGTRFYCKFSFEGGFKWFDIYVEGRDFCDHCVWKIRENGPCFQTEKHQDQCFHWNP